MRIQQKMTEYNSIKVSIWQSALPVLFLILLGACQRDAYHYLKKRKYVECELVGIMAWTSDSYPRYEQFRDQTDHEQLKKYLLSKNVILRTYSYWALIEKSAHGYLLIFDRALQETGEIRQKCGCKGETTSIASSTYFNFWYSQVANDGDSLVFLAPQKLYRLDSLIFNHSMQDQELLEVVKMNGLYKGNENGTFPRW